MCSSRPIPLRESVCVCARTCPHFIPLLHVNILPNSLLTDEHLDCLPCFTLAIKMAMKILLHLSLASCITCISVGLSRKKWNSWPQGLSMLNVELWPPPEKYFRPLPTAVCRMPFPSILASTGSFTLYFCQSDRVKNSTSFYLQSSGHLWVRTSLSAIFGWLVCFQLWSPVQKLFLWSSVISIPWSYIAFKMVTLKVCRTLHWVNALLFTNPLLHSRRFKLLLVLFQLM